MFALSINIYEIFANQLDCQKFELESEGQGVENGILVIRLEMFNSLLVNFCQNFSYLATYIYAKKDTQARTHAHTHTHTVREIGAD